MEDSIVAATKKSPAEKQKPKDFADQMGVEMMTEIVSWLRQEHYDRPFRDLEEDIQWDFMWDLRQAVGDSIRKVARHIAGAGLKTWHGTLEVVQLKDSKAEVRITGSIEDVAELAKAFRAEVVVVRADNAGYEKGMDNIQQWIIRDQKDLPLEKSA